MERSLLRSKPVGTVRDDGTQKEIVERIHKEDLKATKNKIEISKLIVRLKEEFGKGVRNGEEFFDFVDAEFGHKKTATYDYLGLGKNEKLHNVDLCFYKLCVIAKMMDDHLSDFLKLDKTPYSKMSCREFKRFIDDKYFSKLKRQNTTKMPLKVKPSYNPSHNLGSQQNRQETCADFIANLRSLLSAQPEEIQETDLYKFIDKKLKEESKNE